MYKMYLHIGLNILTENTYISAIASSAIKAIIEFFA